MDEEVRRDCELRIWRTTYIDIGKPDIAISFDLFGEDVFGQEIAQAVESQVLTRSTADHLWDYAEAKSVFGISEGVMIRLTSGSPPLLISDWWLVEMGEFSEVDHLGAPLMAPVILESRWKAKPDRWATGKGRLVSALQPDFMDLRPPF